MAENPSLAQQYPELASVVGKGEAAKEKERGNAAFAAKRCMPSHLRTCCLLFGGLRAALTASAA